MELCERCNKRPIYIKKRKLCKLCYPQVRKKAGGFAPIGKSFKTRKKYRNEKEMKFIKNYFNHKNWTYHPALFYLDVETYSPDFYNGETNTFIEVVGTRQAYSQNKHKYALFKKCYPKIKLEIRLSSGELLDENISINSQIQ